MDEWPIYALVDYSGTGTLVELSKSAIAKPLAATSGADLQSDHRLLDLADKFKLTSGYATQESQTTSETGRSGGNKRDNQGDGCRNGLRWLDLIASGDNDGAELYRDRVVSLCSSLDQVIRPYLAEPRIGQSRLINKQLRSAANQRSGRLRASRSLQQPETPDTFSAADSRRNSTVDERLSRASIRRQSWRRQVGLAKGAADEAVGLPEDREATKQPSWALGQDKHTKTVGRTRISDWLQVKPSAACWSGRADARGKYGESLVHLLIVNQSDAHLVLLVLLLHLYPALVNDLFASRKFYGLSCVHLAIAYGDQQLLEYLLDGDQLWSCKWLLAQQVTGSLFKSPIPCKKTARPERNTETGGCCGRKRFCSRVADKPGGSFEIGSSSSELSWERSRTDLYWCDRQQHWPTANGQQHLILFDRLLASGKVASSAVSATSMTSENHPAPTGVGKMTASTADSTNSNLPIYLGATPVAWAVSFRSRTMCELLTRSGADLNSQDEDGNGCLHLVVINDQLTGWTRFLVKNGASLSLANNNQLTPFLLACHLGRCDLFNEFLELSATEFWSYSMIRCCGYPLASLDSILVDCEGVEKVERSAMSIILESSASDNEQKSQLLSSAVVKKLLEEKWRVFARRLFYHELLLTLVHLTTTTLAIALRPMLARGLEQHRLDPVQPSAPNQSFLAPPMSSHSSTLINGWMDALSGVDRQQLLRYLSELISLALSANQLVRFAQEWRRYKNVGLQWTYNPLLPNLVLANALIVLCAILRLASLVDLDRLISTTGWSVSFARAEDISLIFAAPLLWSSLLFFIAAFRVTGPFVAMIRYMIVRDLRQFSVIYLVFLYSFAQSIFFVNYRKTLLDEQTKLEDKLNSRMATQANQTMDTNDGVETTDRDGFLLELLSSYIRLWIDLFKMTLGVYDLQPYRHSYLARLFLLLFMYLIPILFNMLIAMMNNTYSLIISESERAWSFQWARTLFALERRLGSGERSAYLRLYSINMAKPADNQPDDGKESQTTDGGDTSVSEPSGGSSDASQDKRFTPGLMIIKRMDYTHAERRRLVLGYWQKAIRTTLSRLKSKQ